MRIIIPISLILLFSCNNPQENTETNPTPPQGIDTATVLNKLNTTSTFISNSTEFIALEKSGKFIPFKFINDKGLSEKLFEGLIKEGFDSIYSQIVNDSVFIENYFYASGDCEEYRIFEDKSATGTMFSRRAILEGIISDGELESYGCLLTKITAIRFSLPLSKYNEYPAIGYQNQVIPIQ